MDTFEDLRENYHRNICAQLLGYKNKVLNIADRSSQRSQQLAEGMLQAMGYPPCPTPPTGQGAGALFESLTRDYLQRALPLLTHIRPGKWSFTVSEISAFDQYEHLKDLAAALKLQPQLQAALGDYIIRPDIIIARIPLTDEEINDPMPILRGECATLTSLRQVNNPQAKPILHASISCKWTIRSDRSQNARTEGLNLIRNRKGHTPHIAIVTAEPLPSRIASIALGTGDVDYVYHMALYELQKAIGEINDESLSDIFSLLVQGKRLRDISDLPFDLAI
ncbi:MAG TPA: NgoMIV family type II restriction endonuclease [Anaerolineae bacterium]|nr:NgoMIV family type II restriction endonuclease [Anaerolineae bacterium]